MPKGRGRPRGSKAKRKSKRGGNNVPSLMFSVAGPFPVSVENRAGGRALIYEDFWTEKARHYSDMRGCYVFAIQAGRGMTPIYVGKTTRQSFYQETFVPRNLTMYQDGFFDFARGRPVMFFVVFPKRKGRPNQKAIGELEKFLIQAATIRNPNVQNDRGTKLPNWGIQGVLRGRRGQPRSAEVQFRGLFGSALNGKK